MWAPYNWVWRSLVSASALGAEGRGFKSHHLDCEWVAANIPVHNYNCIVNLLAVRTAAFGCVQDGAHRVFFGDDVVSTRHVPERGSDLA